MVHCTVPPLHSFGIEENFKLYWLYHVACVPPNKICKFTILQRFSLAYVPLRWMNRVEVWCCSNSSTGYLLSSRMLHLSTQESVSVRATYHLYAEAHQNMRRVFESPMKYRLSQVARAEAGDLSME